MNYLSIINFSRILKIMKISQIASRESKFSFQTFAGQAPDAQTAHSGALGQSSIKLITADSDYFENIIKIETNKDLNIVLLVSDGSF